jgi:DNA-binding NarL/FixJ family response regulator
LNTHHRGHCCRPLAKPETTLKTTHTFSIEAVILPAQNAPSACVKKMTRREEETLALLAQGFSTKEIGDRLSISVDTVRMHLKNIYKKLHVHSRTQAAVKFLKQ